MSYTQPPMSEDTPTVLPPPPGGVLLSAYAWAEYFEMLPNDEADTFLLDFYSPTDIGKDLLYSIMDNVRTAMSLQGETLLAYGLYRGRTGQVEVPEELCVGDVCFPLSWGGTTIATVPLYRLWMVYRPSTVTFWMRGQIQAIPLLILVLGVLTALVFIPGLIQVMQGKMQWSELFSGLRTIYRTPAENISPVVRETSFPLMALGFVMVATSIALPFALTRARVGLKGGPVTGELELSGGSGRR